MSYLLGCSIMFAILAIHPKHRYEWLVLAFMTFLVWVNSVMFDRNGHELYLNRAILTFIGALLLCVRKNYLGYGHALILLATLATYGVLAYHVAMNTHDEIRAAYKATIYGLVGCQFIGIFPTVWCAYRDINSSSGSWLVNLQRYTRS